MIIPLARRLFDKLNYFRIIRIKTTPTKYTTSGRKKTVSCSRVILYGGEQSYGPQHTSAAIKDTHLWEVQPHQLAGKLRGEREGVSIDMSNNEQQGTHTTGPLSPLFATTIMILPRWDVRAEEVGEGAREPSGWKTCMCGRLREWGT